MYECRNRDTHEITARYATMAEARAHCARFPNDYIEENAHADELEGE
jgi:hypothetical protein